MFNIHETGSGKVQIQKCWKIRLQMYVKINKIFVKHEYAVWKNLIY
jgi:hypothetical protein